MKKTVLLIEDDDALRISLAQMLDIEGITPIQANGFAQAKRHIRSNFSGVILSDIRMPHKDGFDILELTKSIDNDLPVILLTGEADVPMAIRALKEGAYDFLEKPCDSSTLLSILNRALAHRQIVLRARRLEQQMDRNDTVAVNFPGKSQMTKELRSALRHVAEHPVNVHIYGDTGAGKRLAAHTIHSLTFEQNQFIPVKLDDEKTTLPILNNLPKSNINLSLKNTLNASPKIINEIESYIEHATDYRIITSCTKSIKQLKEIDVLTNFFDKISPVEIYVPTLADRKPDLPIIFESLVRQSVRNLNADMPQIPQSIYAHVIARNWPGNLNELRNYALTIALGLNVHKPSNTQQTLAQQMDGFERLVLIESLKQNNGNATRTAQLLGLPRKTFYDRLARYDLRPKDYKAPNV